MSTHSILRITSLASILVLAGMFTGCEKQGQVLALREEFSRQLQAKDKTIEELNQKITDLRNQNDQLQLQAAKGSSDPDKLSSAVADAVAKRVSDQDAQSFAELKRDLEQVLQAVRSSGSVASVPRTEPGPSVPTTRPTAPTAPTRDPSAPSDPNRKKMRFDF